ncbi:MAG: hypothetical protein AB7W44_18480, partial [Pyrinomonadaceae bacterium]
GKEPEVALIAVTNQHRSLVGIEFGSRHLQQLCEGSCKRFSQYICDVYRLNQPFEPLRKIVCARFDHLLIFTQFPTNINRRPPAGKALPRREEKTVQAWRSAWVQDQKFHLK